MFDYFMFKLGVKIDPWPFWTYIWEGGGDCTGFPPSIDVSTPVSTDASTPVSTPVGVYAHLFNFFGNFKNSWKIYEPSKWKKCVSVLEFGAFLEFVAILAPHQQKKRKPKDSTLLCTSPTAKIQQLFVMKFDMFSHFSRKIVKILQCSSRFLLKLTSNQIWSEFRENHPENATNLKCRKSEESHEFFKDELDLS